MTQPPTLLPPDQSDLVLRFFLAFARFEYALKRVNWARRGPQGVAQGNWDKVSGCLRNAEDADRRTVFEAAPLLLKEPPKRQMYEKTKLSWRASSHSGDESERFIRALKQVRNNLFHGGKFSPQPRLGPRSLNLVWSGQRAIDALLALPSLSFVKRAFEEYASEEW